MIACAFGMLVRAPRATVLGLGTAVVVVLLLVLMVWMGSYMGG